MDTWFRPIDTALHSFGRWQSSHCHVFFGSWKRTGIFHITVFAMAVSLGFVISKFYDDYTTNTPKRLKIIDAYLFYIVLTGVIQFVYCMLVGTFPFNSFLSGFISSVGSFILAGKFWNNSYSFVIQITFYISNLSLPATTSQSTKQRPVCQHQSGKRICWFYFCTYYSSSGCNELYWIIR